MKHLLSLLVALIITAAASAQTQNDTIGVFAVYGDSISRIEPLVADDIPPGLKVRLKFNSATSKHHFQNKAVLRLYLGEPSLAMSAKYFMFTVAKDIKDFGISKFGGNRHKRLLPINKCDFNFSKAKNGFIQKWNTGIALNKISDNVYQIEIVAAPGEYCLLSNKVLTGAGAFVFDFTIDKKTD